MGKNGLKEEGEEGEKGGDKTKTVEGTTQGTLSVSTKALSVSTKCSKGVTPYDVEGVESGETGKRSEEKPE